MNKITKSGHCGEPEITLEDCLVIHGATVITILDDYFGRREIVVGIDALEEIFFWINSKLLQERHELLKTRRYTMASKDELLAQAEKAAAAAAKAMEEMDKQKKEMDRLLAEADAAGKKGK